MGALSGRPQLGLEVVAGFMIAGTLSGLCMAAFMDNAGGAWDNAKKVTADRQTDRQLSNQQPVHSRQAHCSLAVLTSTPPLCICPLCPALRCAVLRVSVS